MNARRRTERRRPRDSASSQVTSPARDRPWRSIVLPVGLLCLTLAIIGLSLWRLDPWGSRDAPITGGVNSPSSGSAEGQGEAFEEVAEVPLPPLFSPDIAPDACKVETLRMADQLVEDLPEQIDAIQTSATIHWAMGDMMEALRLWETCIAKDDQFPPAYEGVGRVTLLQGDFDRAIAMLRKGLELEPENRQLTMFLAEALVRANRMDEVVDLLPDYIASGPVSPMVHLFLGQAYLALGQYDDACRVLRIAQRQMPEERQVHFALIKAYDSLGQADKAQEHRDKIKQLIEVYRQAGRGRARNSGLEDTVVKDSVQAHKDAAAAYHRAGNLEEAIVLCRKAAALDPQDEGSWQALAFLYEQIGRASQSQRMKERLRELPRHSAEASQRP